jgi:hypothetical protein
VSFALFVLSFAVLGALPPCAVLFEGQASGSAVRGLGTASGSDVDVSESTFELRAVPCVRRDHCAAIYVWLMISLLVIIVPVGSLCLDRKK